MGKPIKLTPSILEQIEQFASRGLTRAQISHNLGWSAKTFYNKQNEIEEIRQAINRGRFVGIHQLSNKLFEEAMEGNTTAAIYMLKCLDPENWNERRNAKPPVKLVDMEKYTDQEIREIAYKSLEQILKYERKKGLPPRAQQLLWEYEEGLKPCS